jgi:eukaryotic-like serine/threonine-protein kinase
MAEELPADPLIGKRFGPEDRYEVIRKLGSGGFGEVYLAHDHKRNWKVALKLMRPNEVDTTAMDRFWREGEKYGMALRHPQIAKVRKYGTDRGRYFIAFEYIEGRTLKQILESDGPFDVDEALRIARDVASGLEPVHRINVVHRDLKPSNVMLTTASHEVKILDFGIAKDLMSTGVTRANRPFVGTLGYAAPEQTAAEAIDHRADIFALGAVLYEIITGEYAFRGTTDREVARAVRDQNPIPPTKFNSSVTQPVVSLIAKMLKKNPRRRPADVTEVIVEIDRIRAALAEGGDAAEPGGIAQWLRKLISGVT